MIRYYVGGAPDAPEPVECEKPGWPFFDARGRQQYDNTHFDTLAEAWEELYAEVSAGLSLATNDVETAKRRLAEAESELVRTALWYERVRQGLEQAKGLP